MKAQVIEILATDEYFHANGNKLDMTNFTGGITIHDWRNGFQGGIYYKNGVRVGYINEYIVTTNIQPALKKIDNNQRVSDCGYQYSYVNNGEIYIVWVYQLCMSDWWMLYYNNPYHAQAYIDSQYGCEVSFSCVGDTNPPPYYEPEPEPTWAGKDLGFPDTWWLDEVWLDANFFLNIDQGGQYDRLTAAEKALIKLYPVAALLISGNAEDAHAETFNRFGVNGLNDKSDAFRHTFFNAMNERDCGNDPTTLESIARKFSDAHESEVPSQLSLEKSMDLWNNNIGHSIGDVMFPILSSDSSLSDEAMQKVLGGELKYLNPLDFNQSPRWPTGLDGIISSTILIYTNQ